MLARHGLLQRSSNCLQCAIRNRILIFQQKRERQSSARTKLIRKHNSTTDPRFASPQSGVGRYGRPMRAGTSEADVAKEIYHCLRDMKDETVALFTAQEEQKGLQSGRKGDVLLGPARGNMLKQWRDFENAIMAPFGGIPSSRHSVGDSVVPIRSHKYYSSKVYQRELQGSWKYGGKKMVTLRLNVAFRGFLASTNLSARDLESQKQLADLRYPTEWFPATRNIKRQIHMHIGPTNSGKTYQALQRLEQAKSGIYAGPLRLLAHEVYARMNAKGIPCNLVTGEEVRVSPLINQFSEDPDINTLKSCTVEMIDTNSQLDVAVIDEIQMIGDVDRGWAWTQALLGCQAKEVHLCGEPRALPVVKELCALVGDELIVHNYERLSPLKVAERSLGGNLKLLRKGDCVISFSVMGIHAMRKQIETATGRKVAVVYGSLPPETRAQQARLFNDPNNDYDYLVASDAVGMGLNLAIKRVIFESATKFDGTKFVTLATADIKQIGGRAGRFRTADQATDHVASTPLAAAKGEPVAKAIPSAVVQEGAPQQAESIDTSERGTLSTLGSLQRDLSTTLPPPLPKADDSQNGIVTTLQDYDFPIVARAMNSEPPPIKTAGLYVPDLILERFHSYFPKGTPFSYILARLHDLATIHPRFHMCGLKDQLWIADLVQKVEGLTASDRNTIIAAPASRGDAELWVELIPALASCIAEQRSGNILDMPEVPLEILDIESSSSRDYLRLLERLHKGIVTWLWLSYRFAGIFDGRATAMHVKSIVEGKIEEALSKISVSAQLLQKKLEAQKRAALAAQLAAEAAETTDETEVQQEEVDEDPESRDAETELYLRDVLEKRGQVAENEDFVSPLEVGLSADSETALGADHAGFDEEFQDKSQDTFASDPNADVVVKVGADQVSQEQQKQAVAANS